MDNSLDKNSQLREKNEKNPLSNLRSEFHFLKYPFFNLYGQQQSKINEIEIIEKKETDKEKIETLWIVSRNTNYGFPSSFARKLHKQVVEKILNSTEKPVPRLIRLGSIRQICKMLGIAASGRSEEKIKKALDDIKFTAIKVKKTFRQKEKNGTKKFFEGGFNLYDMYFLTGQTLPDGTKADAIYILLNDMYIQNFNNNFVVPLDYQYFQSLKGDIASRMYEVLNIWFYPALENRKECIQKKYSELCTYFPLTRRNKKFIAKGQLKDAYRQHISSGFLACEPEWIDTNKKDNWLIEYRIGLRAKKWYIENNKLGNIGKEIKQLEEMPYIEERDTETVEENNDDDQNKNNPLILKLINFGVTASVAENLVENYDSDFIEYWIVAASKKENVEDRSAFLVKAIKENWGLPSEIEKKRRKAKEKEEEKLKAEYNNFIIAKVDECLKEMKKEEMEKELKDYKEIFLKKCNYPEELKEIVRTTKPSTQIIYNYKIDKARKLDLDSFEEWRLKVN